MQAVHASCSSRKRGQAVDASCSCNLTSTRSQKQVGKGQKTQGRERTENAEKGKDRKRREGKGREGKGREGEGRGGKGREGKGREGRGREGEADSRSHRQIGQLRITEQPACSRYMVVLQG